jgi:hypothetical protein
VTWSIFEVVAQRDADALRARLFLQGCPVRELDGTGVTDGLALQRRAAEAFGYEAPEESNWDAFADSVWMPVLPTEEEGDKVALLWEHVDDLMQADVRSFLTAFDVLIGVARQAYGSEGLDVTIFVLGDGPGFPPLPPA